MVPNPWIQPTMDHVLPQYVPSEKKSVCEWSCALQTRVVQGSAVITNDKNLYFVHVKNMRKMCIPLSCEIQVYSVAFFLPLLLQQN